MARSVFKRLTQPTVVRIPVWLQMEGTHQPSSITLKFPTQTIVLNSIVSVKKQKTTFTKQLSAAVEDADLFVLIK